MISPRKLYRPQIQLKHSYFVTWPTNFAQTYRLISYQRHDFPSGPIHLCTSDREFNLLISFVRFHRDSNIPLTRRATLSSRFKLNEREREREREKVKWRLDFPRTQIALGRSTGAAVNRVTYALQYLGGNATCSLSPAYTYIEGCRLGET